MPKLRSAIGTIPKTKASDLQTIRGITSATSTTVADADRVVFNDDGTMVQVAVTDLAAYFDDEITAMPNLVTTAATTVGALNSGSITSGFGTIDTGSSTITTTGLISGGSLDIDNVLIDGTTIGHTDDTDLITVADGLVTVAGELQATTLDIGGTNITSTAAELNLLDGSSAGTVVNSKGVIYSGTGTVAGTLSTAAQGNITSLGTLTTLTVDSIIINGTNIGHTSDADAIAIASSGNVTVSQDLSVSGDLTVSGTTTTVDSTVLTVVDPIIHLQTASGGGALGSDTNKDVGLALQYHTGSAAKTAFLGYDDSAGKLTFIPDATLSSEVVSGTVGSIVANLEGNVTGNVTGNINGDLTGTLQTAAQGNVTSLGTLTALTVDNIAIDGTTIGHTGDTDLMTLASGIVTVAGELQATTLDIGGTNITATAAEINLIDGGTSRGTTAVASGDGILINDGGTMRMTNVDTVSTYFASHTVGGGNIVTTGALNSGSITSGFGTIDTGSSTITTTGLISGGSLDIDNVLIDGTTIGHTDDTDLMTVADGLLTIAGEISVTTLDIGGTNVTSTAAELNILDGVTSTAAELNILDGVTSTAAELNIMDGGTSATSTTLVDADRVVVNDAGTMKQVALTDLTTYNESSTNVTITRPTSVAGSNAYSIAHDSGDTILVWRNGVLLDDSDVSSNAGNDTVTFTCVNTSEDITIQVIKALSVRGFSVYTPTAVSGSNAYSVTNQSGDTINVYRNGVLLDSSEISISAGNNTVTFTCVDTSDKIMIQVIQAVATSAPTAMGGTLTTDITMPTNKKVQQKGAFLQSSTHQALALGY